MEQIYWQELQNVVEREDNPLNEIISMVDLRRGNTNLTAALRVFIICYMQESPTAQHEDADRAAADGTHSRRSGGPERVRKRADRIARALDVVGPPRKSAAG